MGHRLDPARVLIRVGFSVAVVAISSVMIFLLVHASGDPLRNMRMSPGISAEDVARASHDMGLDRPLAEQYFSWAGGFIAGDLGQSLSRHRPVSDLIWERLPATLELMGIALVLSLVIAITVGTWQALYFLRPSERIVSGAQYTAMSMPVFWVALLLQIFLGYTLSNATGLHIFYTGGQWSPGLEGDPVNGLQHLALPVMVLVIAQAAVWTRYHRASMLETLAAPYLRGARALGLPERTVLIKYALPRSLAPLVAIVAVDLAMLFSGAVVTETVFSWPGVGALFLSGLKSADYPLIMAILMITALLVILFNLLGEIIIELLDPRVGQIEEKVKGEHLHGLHV